MNPCLCFIWLIKCIHIYFIWALLKIAIKNTIIFLKLLQCMLESHDCFFKAFFLIILHNREGVLIEESPTHSHWSINGLWLDRLQKTADILSAVLYQLVKCEAQVMFLAISYYPTLNWSFIKKGPVGTRSNGRRFRSLPTYHQAF